jgi:hypothetical protein
VVSRLLVAALLLGACAPSEATVGGACSTSLELRGSFVCCAGRWINCSDCAGFPRDAGPPDGGWPDASLACSDEGSTGCVGVYRVVCRSGTWTSTVPTQLCGVPGCS